jgi:hypothetical protein
VKWDWELAFIAVMQINATKKYLEKNEIMVRKVRQRKDSQDFNVLSSMWYVVIIKDRKFPESR